MKIGYILFENFWQRKNIGSSRIRGYWMIEKLNTIEGIEAEVYQQGGEYDVIVFQKVYWNELAKNLNAIKIADICDPDWMDGAGTVAFCQYVDAITVPTQKLKDELEVMTNKPTFLIPDRENIQLLPTPKVHKGIAKKVVWFGYSGNLEALEPALDKLKSMNLIVKIISDGDFHAGDMKIENVKWDIETEMQEIQDADISLLPELKKGRFAYKSNNKTVHAWALGLPVARTEEELIRFMDEKERIKESELRLKEMKEKYDVRQSAEELVEVIEKAKVRRNMNSEVEAQMGGMILK